MPGFTINSIKIPLGNILNTTLKDIIQVRQTRINICIIRFQKNSIY